MTHGARTNPPANAPHIVIVGGGITGLACALRLRELDAAAAALGSGAARASRARPRITLLEAGPHLGGKLVSEHVQGFVIDAGADIFLASKPGAMELCGTLGLGERVIGTDPARRRTFVREGTTLVPATHYGEERLATLVGGMQELVDAAARALDGVEVLTCTEAESVQARIDPSTHVAEGGYVVRAASRAVASPVASPVAAPVAAQRAATRAPEKKSMSISLDADAVVIAVPARAAADILRPLASDAATHLDDVRYRSSFTVSAAYRADDVPHGLDGYGYMVPDAAAGEVSACTWTSSKIPSRAPAGHVLLRGYVHGAPGLTTTRARDAVLDEFRRVLGITVSPLFTRQYAWHDALPSTRDDQGAGARAVRSALERHRGIAIAGGAVDGAGIPDSIRSGQAAAEQLSSFLAAAPLPFNRV